GKSLSCLCVDDLGASNVGVIIKNLLSREKVKKGQSFRVGPGFEEPFDDDVSTEDEMARVDYDRV
ncbi:hypothetical protein HAX54_047384, partial [Datura stramonium]|nr:hypothetical protein [Datura stramonium]